ncbi:hypothetical protein L3Q67_00920 [Saccharothrix sp. AJ9571]|nr:hypothetical protein L3Q67_00920 [Saccharothrix sp. AJ9571]
MSDVLRSWVRTVVPTLWAAVIAWAISRGLPESFAQLLAGAADELVVPVVLAAVFAALRKLEPLLPTWLGTLLLGSTVPPTYSPPSADGQAHVVTDAEPPRHSAG